MLHILNQVLPILFLMGLGAWIRRTQFLTAPIIEALQKLVINVALPSVLFISFLKIEFQPAYFVLFVLIFGLCVGLFLLGRALHKGFNLRYASFPYLTTGFEYGLLGISLFGAAYGLDKIGFIAVVDLGHEFFVWFLFLPLLLVRRDGVQKPREIIRAFLSAPVVLAILSGLLFNALRAQTWLYEAPVTGAFIHTLELLGQLTVPLMLIVVGYGIQITLTGAKEALWVVLIRMGVLIPLAVGLNVFLLRGILHLDPWFETALFTLLILPPPFIVPLYSPATLSGEEKQYLNNVLTLHTILSVAVFVVVFVWFPRV
ncbi:MAG TPA: hypothetical protein PK530_20540 [Anaerolineales bacterium]|nr:hypothetical protein [Anaerolineales bacterium]